MTKICKKCGIEKALEQFSINRSAKDGRLNSCKPCEVKRVAQWAAANPDKVQAWVSRNRERNLRASLPPGATQKCSCCMVEKPIDEFHANSRSKLNTRKTCKACASKHMKEKYVANADCIRQKSARWRAENPQRNREALAKYHRRNRDRLNEYRRQLRIKNIEKEREDDRRYVLNNLAKFCAKNARRRAAKGQATPAWLNAIQRAQVQEFYELALARKMQTGIDQHVDHIVPLRGRGVRGLHVPWNLQILTESENCAKHNKVVDERI